jgi:hypothetical protein
MDKDMTSESLGWYDIQVELGYNPLEEVEEEEEEEEEDIDPQPSLLDVKAYPTLNALFGRYDDDEKI